MSSVKIAPYFVVRAKFAPKADWTNFLFNMETATISDTKQAIAERFCISEDSIAFEAVDDPVNFPEYATTLLAEAYLSEELEDSLKKGYPEYPIKIKLLYVGSDMLDPQAMIESVSE